LHGAELPTIKKTDKQKKLIQLIGQHTTVLAYGGSRSGKTFGILYAIIVRALSLPSRHLITRFRFAHAKQAICYDTMPKVLEAMGLRGVSSLNKTDWFYEFPNGSTIWIGGLDDKERTEKILGNEYATIFLNEASQISYDAYEMILTRLNPPKGMRGKMIIDYNPPSIQHWGYKIFERRQFPDGRPVPEDDYKSITLNPHDNPHLDPDYIKRLESLSMAKRKRFLEGGYTLDSGSLWRREWIRYNRELPKFSRIVVAVDPAGTVGGDEIGIIVAGKAGELYWILDDYSLNGTPAEWSAEVKAAYTRWEADIIVAEKNYGGDMVEHTIRTNSKECKVKLINSSRGKIVRAEPISALYERGLVYHREAFPELEDEYCIYEPDTKQSPNRLDAAVFALAELSGGKEYTELTASNVSASSFGF